MQNITITIDGVTKQLEVIDMKSGERTMAEYFINRKWYREISEVKQGYEIQSFRNEQAKGIIYPLNKDCVYGGGEYVQMTLDYCLLKVETGRFTIHSVKRLSDGEVFTVGDNLGSRGNVIKIELIEISGVLGIVLYFKHSFVLLKFAEKVKQPTVLLTTYDGITITNPNQQIYICHKNFNRGECFANFISTNPHNLYFSTQESRDEYILYNKPVSVSIEELTNRIIFQPAQKDLLVAFFKQKII